MKTLGAIDIGTNSIRLEVVRIEDDFGIATLSQQKEPVRLGEGEFKTNRLTNAAIARGVLVCSRFAEMARGFGADEIIALATSAVREAENQHEFLEQVRDEAGIEVRVISGPEEARLIYQGVASGADLGEKRAVFVDIGGGSTELILGDASNHFLLDSMKLGSIRLAGRFLEGEKGPVSPEKYAKMRNYAKAILSHAARRFADYGFDSVYGSAGTITNLADVTARRLGDAPNSLRNYVVRTSDLQATVDLLCRLPLEERRRVPGLDADRADIICGGGAILMTVLEELRAEEIRISDRGLRHGIIVDRVDQERPTRAEDRPHATRRTSILQLARACKFDEEHALNVVQISHWLFDELRRLGFHPYGARERELLEYAALVHDIGCFLSHSNHQKHAYYLVRFSDLLGFNDTEIDTVANVAYYHRKAMPKSKHENLQNLTRQGRKLVAVLASVLRVAEGLDRSHLGLVKGLRLERLSRPDRVAMTLTASTDCQLEIWGVETNKDLFEDLFGTLTIEIEPPAAKRAKPKAATRA